MSEHTRSATDIDPVVRAAAELHAREAGQTLSQYLAGLVFDRPTAGDMDRGLEKWAGHQLRLNHHWADSEEFRHWNMRVRETLLPDVSASPTLKLVFVFNSRLHSAALLMGAAFHEASVSDFELPGISVHRFTASRQGVTGTRTLWMTVSRVRGRFDKLCCTGGPLPHAPSSWLSMLSFC